MTDSSYNYTNNGSELKMNTSLAIDSSPSDAKDGQTQSKKKSSRDKSLKRVNEKKNLKNHRS